ncbi:I10R1 protein, partial [Brachypteracias leptosomus]|nr:I10R1 protein [Brachypteracias leptosomus]
GEKLARPKHVHFAAETAHHLLRWEPGHPHPSHVLYEVELKVYGTNISWTPIPNCRRISGHSCDLTYYTLDPAPRYYARVRAVAGNHTSNWQRTNSFSPKDARLCLSGQSLSVTGNTIHVELQLLLRVENLTVNYEDIQRHARQYQVYVRRTQDNFTLSMLETTPEFDIRNLLWDTEYCVSVEPRVASRNTPATRTDEQCLTTGQRDWSTELVLSISSSSFITLLLLSLLGLLLVCTYIKKPVRPPSVLKSFIKQSSLWVEEESKSSSSGSQEADAVQQLFLCQKEPQKDSVPISSTAQPPLEQGWRLPAWPGDWVHLLGPGVSTDSSCTSTDSGICLQSSSEPSCSSGPEPQGYKQQLPTGDDSGVGLGGTCPHPTCSSGSGNTSSTETKQPHGVELETATSQDNLEFHGYLQQSKGTVQPRQDPAKRSEGHTQGPGTTGTVLDVECSELAVVKGYLKQSSPEHPLSHRQDFAPWGAPQDLTSWDFSIQVGPQVPTLLSYGAPGAPLASKGSTELLRSPFDLGIFNTDLLGPLPLISSLSTSKRLSLQTNPLSLLSGDSKDSRL